MGIDVMQGSQLLLVEQALAAYETGDLAGSLALIERACRIGFPKAEHLLLRGVILDDLGHFRLAEAALRQAAATDPSDLVARQELLRRVAPRLEEGTRRQLARSALDVALDAQLVDLAAPLLGVRRGQLVGTLRRRGESLEISLIAESGGVASVKVLFGSAEKTVEVRLHSGNTRARRYTHRGEAILEWPPDATEAVCEPSDQVSWLRSRQVKLRQQQPEALPRNEDADVSVIVPLYKDARTSARCIVSVLSDRVSRANWRLIIVNDASPEPEMAQVLALAEKDPRVTALNLQANSGFIAAINAGLALAGRSDVLLLNSDTIVAPGWIDRLRAAAASDARIGTVTPLSNNGEAVSFPAPFIANPMPAPEEVAELDRLAAEVNAGKLVSLPSGIGFALYISRACLDSIGFLDDHRYQDGYLEEVDFCLRAKAAGFFNVCATDVFVGHVGNVSFGERKAALVALNGVEIARRYPQHEAQCRFFIDADPLRAARERLQAAWLAAPDMREAVSLIISSAKDGEAEPLRSIVQRLSSTGGRHILMLLGHAAREGKILVDSPGGGLPHRASCPVPNQLDWRGLREALPRFEIRRICFADLGPALEPLLRSLAEAPCPVDIVIGDASAICPRLDLLRGGVAPCGGQVAPGICRDCLDQRRPSFVPAELNLEGYRPLRSEVLRHASAIYAEAGLDERAGLGHAARLLPPLSGSDAPDIPAGPAGAPLASPGLAIVPVHRTISDFQHMLGLVHAIGALSPGFRVVVLGTTLDDEALARLPHVTVVGPADTRELATLLRLFDCGPILLHQFATEFFLPWFDAAIASGAAVFAPDTLGFRALQMAGAPLRLLKHEKSFPALAKDLDQYMKTLRQETVAGDKRRHVDLSLVKA